jgi:hypothetical protein
VLRTLIHVTTVLLFFATAIVLLCSEMALCSIDFWVNLAQIVQGFLTPVIVLFLGIITYQIQRQQARTQQHQADTHRLEYRFGLMDRRMKIFDATLGFIALVVQNGHIETLGPLFTLMRSTRERHLLFGKEISEYIDELYSKGVSLNEIYEASGPQHIIRPEDIQKNTAILHWFSGQYDLAKEKFLKYMDFRKP